MTDQTNSEFIASMNPNVGTTVIRTSENSAGGSVGEVSRCRRMTRRLALLLFHRRFVLAFSIFMFWTIGRYSTALRKYSTKRRLLLSSLFDPASSGLRALEQRVE
uniref:Uncharacterized protein n=1 Tax=Solanum tuberosum TaxID=4113 RepID=M1E1A1_SOLTU